MTLTAEVIEGFSASLLQKNFDGAVQTPACHREFWKLFCDPHPQVAIAAPRRHAKTTAITHTCTLAAVLFRERQYVLVVSDTVTQAIQFIGDIKNELMNNEALRTLFKIKAFPKDSEDDFIVQMEDGHQFRIAAKGAEQKLRGLKWDNRRPDLIICDDLENDEIVLNKERREKFKRWFYASLLPCRSYRGIVRYVGTILHNDALLENLMPKRGSKWYKEDELKSWSTEKRAPWLSVKYRAHNADFSALLWPSLYDKAYFVNLRNDYISQGIPDVYSQEYLNYPLDESLSYFRRSDFVDFTDQDREMFRKPEWKKRMNIYIGSDLAVSTEESADWSVFLVGAVSEDGMLYVLNVIRERMDSQTIVETILSLHRRYDPVCISMEKGQIEKSIGPFLHERMLSEQVFPQILKIAPSSDKKTRAQSIKGRMRMGGVRFDKNADWFYDLEDEAVLFGRGKHDDQVDALSYLGLILNQMVEGRTEQEVSDDEYADELAESGSGDDGRSEWSGY
jgi:predicted phage terminase large subunit-like protein